MSDNETAIITAEIIAETEEAILIDDSTQEVWVPKSLISDKEQASARGTMYHFTIQQWFAIKEGLV